MSNRRPPRGRRPRDEQPAPEQLSAEQAAAAEAAAAEAVAAESAAAHAAAADETAAVPVASSGSQPGRGRPRREREGFRPRGFEDVQELSDEEVERRVSVRGGAPPRAPVERPVRTARPPRREERTVARDSLLLIGLVIVGLVTVRLLLPDGPLTAVSTSSPGATLTAAGSPSAGAPSPSRTPSLITLPPGVTPTPGPPVTEAPPTVAPTPTPTLKPGETPHPTPKPTPKPTAKPTAGPPATATVLVKMHVVNNSGGDAQAGDWTMTIGGEAGSSASDNNFPGSEDGTSVTIPAGQGFQVLDDNSQAGYAKSVQGTCLLSNNSAGLTPGAEVTCTITRNDRPRVLVKTHVINDDGGSAEANAWNVTMNSANAAPPTFEGTEAGRLVIIGIDLDFQVQMSGPTGYTETDRSGNCGGLTTVDDPETTCTVTFNDDPPPPSPLGLAPIPFLPVLPVISVPLLRPRRWRTTPTG